MSTGGSKKGKERSKAVFVESSAQMTKSRNNAEENILRHKLKELESQRRRSILAMKEEEKLLIRDLETQTRGSLTMQTTDNDKPCSRKDQLEAKYSNNSRRNSYRSSDESDNIPNPVSAVTSHPTIGMNKNTSSRRPSFNTDCDNKDIHEKESRKHLWKHPKSTTALSREGEPPLNSTTSKKYHTRIHSEDDRLHMSDFVKDLTLGKNNKMNSCDTIISSSSWTKKSDLSPKQSGRVLASLSNTVVSRTKSIDVAGVERLEPEKTSTPKDKERPTKARTKSEERRDRSMMSLAKRAGSLKWTSFEELDNEINSAYGMIDKHAKKMSRSVNINIGEETNDKKESPYASVSTAEHSHLNGSVRKSVHRLTNSIQDLTLSSCDAKLLRSSQSLPRNGARQPAVNRNQIDNRHRLDPPETHASGSKDCPISRHKTNHVEKLNIQNDSNYSHSTQMDIKSTKDTIRRNSVGRSKIVLSPIASRRNRSQSNGYIPSCVEKQPVKKTSKKRRSLNDKIEPLKFSIPNHVTSDSDSGGSNVSRRGSIPENQRKSSMPSSLELPIRPLSSWSQRKRSIIFGEKSPQTAREVLNDTHAQWEELGDFLGEIRKQHNVDNSRLSSSRRNSKTESSPSRPDEPPTRRSSNFASLVEQRLLPRRHSESNIILLSHAAKGSKRDALDLRHGATPSYSRRKSLLPSELSSCAVADHGTRNTSVKKLVTIHNALQSSAMSMADMESELF